MAFSFFFCVSEEDVNIVNTIIIKLKCYIQNQPKTLYNDLYQQEKNSYELFAVEMVQNVR